jgi:hypothetical protein
MKLTTNPVDHMPSLRCGHHVSDRTRAVDTVNLNAADTRAVRLLTEESIE